MAVPDVPIIMGISPFKTRFDLLLEKAQYEENDFDGNEYTEYGNIMEDKIRTFINNTMGRNFKEGKHEFEDIRCHTDGEDSEGILEVKTTSQIHDNVNDYQVYLVQLLFYMQQTNNKHGLLAVYERPKDFDTEFDEKRLVVYPIEIDNYLDLLENINKAVEQFRIDLQKVKENPLITEEELMPTQVVELSSKLALVESELTKFNNLVEQQKKLKDELKNAMQKYGIKKWITNNGSLITLVPDGEDKVVNKFNEKKFSEENEELYNKYLEEKIQKGKSGYVRVTLKGEE